MNRKFLSLPLRICIIAGLCTSVMTASASGEDPKEDGRKKNFTNAFASLNNSSVRIYPDMLKRDMHVIAKDHDGREIDFFVFDLQGTLIQHFRMNAKDRRRITNLERGKYIYRVFCGDDETAAGKFEIR